MGRYVSQVGRYRAEYGDYQWDYIKDKQSLEYYQKYKFNITIENLKTKEEFDIDVPILDNFIYVKLLRKNYTYNSINKPQLFTWLFNYVVYDLKEKIYCVPYIDIYNYNIDMKYYLKSIEGDDIILSNNKKHKVIVNVHSISQIEFLEKNGLDYYWCDKNGVKF